LANYELGDRARAVVELTELTEGFAESMPHCRVLAHIWLTQAYIDSGELDAAEVAYEQAESLVDRELFGPGGRDWLLRAGTQLALARGDNHEAVLRAQDVSDPFWRGVSVARVRLTDDVSEAFTALRIVQPRCVRHEVVLGLVRARAAQDRAAALTYSMGAVDHAIGAGMLQTIVSEGPEAVSLAEAVAWHAPRSWLERLRRASGAHGTRSEHDARLEPLSPRELEVLRLLPSRLSTREIADELFISINTLKFHLKVIYRKLGVATRADAADAARDFARAATHAP
jgi:LuxR family maltose regulon positive regulatory protein